MFTLRGYDVSNCSSAADPGFTQQPVTDSSRWDWESGWTPGP